MRTAKCVWCMCGCGRKSTQTHSLIFLDVRIWTIALEETINDSICACIKNMYSSRVLRSHGFNQSTDFSQNKLLSKLRLLIFIILALNSEILVQHLWARLQNWNDIGIIIRADWYITSQVFSSYQTHSAASEMQSIWPT